MKKGLKCIISVLIFVILACLPVVPVTIVPVVLNPTPSFRKIPFHRILRFALTRPDGVSYQYDWTTYLVLLILLAVGCLASVLIFKMVQPPQEA